MGRWTERKTVKQLTYRWTDVQTDRMGYGHMGYSVGQTDGQKDRWMDIKMG